MNTPAAWSERAQIVVDPFEAVRWSEPGQRQRFEKTLWALDANPGDTLLDYGCGTGALSEWLGEDVKYVGYDWAQGMVERAKREHPKRLFSTSMSPWVFDLVACVGPFNLAHNWSKQQTWHTLRHLWDTTGCRALACSLYCGVDPDCIGYTVEECERFAAGMTFHHEVERWRSNDIMLVLRR